jgi:hypothetical protein
MSMQLPKAPSLVSDAVLRRSSLNPKPYQKSKLSIRKLQRYCIYYYIISKSYETTPFHVFFLVRTNVKLKFAIAVQCTQGHYGLDFVMPPLHLLPLLS